MNNSPHQRGDKQPIGSETLPGMEVQDLVEAQRRGIDALIEAQMITAQDAHAVARKQADIMRETFNRISSLATEVIQAGNPQQTAVVDSKAIQAGLERAFEHMRELMGAMIETNMSVFDVMNSRIADMFDQSEQ